MKKSVLYILAFILSNALIAQSDSLSIFGTATDTTGDVVPFANVSLYENENQILGTTTDFDGKYRLRPIKPGIYAMEFSFVGYLKKEIERVELSTEDRNIDAILEQDVDFNEVIIMIFIPPYFRKEITTTGKTFSRQEIQHMPF